MLHLLFLQITVFSQFIDKELHTARNIKSRVNRHNVIVILNKINEYYKIKKFELGVFIFAGVDNTDNFFLYSIEPLIKCDIFVYNCSNKFNPSFVSKYMNLCEGSIVFANGNECYIYRFDTCAGTFVQFKHINGNLIKRHKKGGQSALRFARLAEESRLHYTTYIIDWINKLNTSNRILLFGSLEIINMIKSRCNKNIELGGFLEFDSNTIKDVQKWIGIINDKSSINPYLNIYKEIIKLLDTNPDRLDFDPKNKDQMKWWIGKATALDKATQSDNFIPYPNPNTEYSSRINIFEYIGVKFFVYEQE